MNQQSLLDRQHVLVKWALLQKQLAEEEAALKQQTEGQLAQSALLGDKLSESSNAKSETQIIAKWNIAPSGSSWERCGSEEAPETKTNNQREAIQGAWTTSSGEKETNWKQRDTWNTGRSSRDLSAASPAENPATAGQGGAAGEGRQHPSSEQPDVHSAPVPGAFISHGDCFLVSHEHQGAYGVLYLKLHKSGLPWEVAPSALSPPPLWAYDRLPKAQEPMAVRYLQL